MEYYTVAIIVLFYYILYLIEIYCELYLWFKCSNLYNLDSLHNLFGQTVCLRTHSVVLAPPSAPVKLKLWDSSAHSWLHETEWCKWCVVHNLSYSYRTAIHGLNIINLLFPVISAEIYSILSADMPHLFLPLANSYPMINIKA